MTKKEKAIAIEKKIECIIGVLFLIVPIIAVFCFLLNWFGIADEGFVVLRHLSGEWTYHYDSGGGASSPAPIFIGLMALAGAYLVKDGIRYFILKDSDMDQ